MEAHEFDIVIRPGGEVKIEVKGAKGPACMEYVKFFESILGEAREVEHTAEYYEPPSGVEIHLDERA